MTANADVISVDSGMSNPYQHTWQIGLNIARWWPIGPIQGGYLTGNDGKLWAFANDKFYGYIHGETSGGTPTGRHYLTIEIQGCSSLNVQFWLGVGGNKPTRIPPDNLGTDDGPGILYQAFSAAPLQLNTNYYFQITVSANGPGGGDYYIGNCAPGCADTWVSGFPIGCYLYSWREDNTVLNLSQGGNWAEDKALWTTTGGGGGGGGGGPVQPVCPCPHIWLGISTPGTNLSTCSLNVGKTLTLSGISGFVNSKDAWIAGKYDTSVMTLHEHDVVANVTRSLATTTPNKTGGFKFAFTRSTALARTYSVSSSKYGETSNHISATWTGVGSSGGGTTKPVTPTTFEGSTPTACTSGTDNYSVFVRGTDGGIYVKNYAGGAWQAWYDIQGVTGDETGPGACSPGSGRMDVFTGGTGGTVWHKWLTKTWSAWQNLGGVTTSSCGAVCPSSSEWCVFVRGQDSHLYLKSWYSGAWTGWAKIGAGGNILAGTGPAACSWAPGRIDVVVAGTNGHIYHIAFTGTWGSWEDLGGSTSASPAIATLGSGKLGVFTRGTNGILYLREYNGGAWQPWVELGGELATGTGPGVCVNGGQYHVFVAGTDGHVYHGTGTGVTWYTWENLGGLVSISTTEPTGEGIVTTIPKTTPDQPADVTLTPVEPIPTAITEGVTIVLRDHKKGVG
jgi:hypothetical protein